MKFAGNLRSFFIKLEMNEIRKLGTYIALGKQNCQAYEF